LRRYQKRTLRTKKTALGQAQRRLCYVVLL
jgi:hypothetical protein